MGVSPEQRLETAIRLARIGLIVFIVGTVTAIATYSDDYSFSRSYLSLLGRFQGNPLQPHAWFFNGSLAFFGGTLIWFYHLTYRVARYGPGGLQWCAMWGQGAGTALVLVAFTPVDLLHWPHNVCMSAWLICMVMSMLGWLDWQSGRSKEQQASAMATHVLRGVVIYPIAVAMSFGPLLQKLIVIAAIGWLGHLYGQVDEALATGRVSNWLQQPTRTKKKRRPDVKYIEKPNR